MRRGSTRSSEGRFPSSRSSPPATGKCCCPFGQSAYALYSMTYCFFVVRLFCTLSFLFNGLTNAGGRLRRAFAEGEQPVSQTSETEVQLATTLTLKPSTHKNPSVRRPVFVDRRSTRLSLPCPRRGFLGGACGLRNSELAPPKGFLSFQQKTKLQIKIQYKTILQSSYIKNDNPH